jgi:flagellar hook-basal body complex protein FliE
MAIPPIAPPALDGGLAADFQLPALDGSDTTTSPVEGSGFGDALTKALGQLGDLQDQAAGQSQALATGKADDVASVAMAVERASLALQLAAQVRNKLVEAAQDIFHTQI